MVMRAQVRDTLLTEDPKAKRGSLEGGRQNAKMRHDSFSWPLFTATYRIGRALDVAGKPVAAVSRGAGRCRGEYAC
jgi:hypothetical protein